jgi:hypothetical protein
MPIVRSYMCEECGHMKTVTLTMEEWDAPAPHCSHCDDYSESGRMRQEFKPVAINGSPAARARDIAEDIAANDYHVADMQHEKRVEGTPKVRYKDETAAAVQSQWRGVPSETMAAALAAGRETRLNFGSGLDVLQAGLKNGTVPDLIENSKKRAMRVY